MLIYVSDPHIPGAHTAHTITLGAMIVGLEEEVAMLTEQDNGQKGACSITH